MSAKPQTSTASKATQRRVRVKRTSERPTTSAKPIKFEVLPEFEKWTASDVSLLRAFLGSATGEKLVKICGSETHKAAMIEATGATTPKRAHGMDWLLRFQFNLASDEILSRAAGAQAEITTGGAENDALPDGLRRSFE